MGLDDTDSPRGGCTTYALTELVRLARELGLDLLGEPRLVRLNPNIPWKTRGNAALSARFGRGRGPRTRAGEIDGRAVWSYARGHAPPDRLQDEFFEAAWERLLTVARPRDAGTDPALVMAPRRLPSSLYWRAVREVVPVAAARTALEAGEARWKTLGSDRGLVGAAASIAWPGGHPTWELIAYRDPAREGRPRSVDADSIRAVQARFPSLFLCHDPRTRRILVAPHTPCPILFGLRSIDRASPRRALPAVRSEPVVRWMEFRTNQGSGDHLVRRGASAIPEYGAAIVDGTVDRPPIDLTGGHVRLTIVDPTSATLDCLAFEPTKTLPAVARSLEVGDRVRLWGSRAEDASFRLEGITLARLVPRRGPPRAPRCRACDRAARSLGTGRGYRCASCHRRWPPEAAERVRRPPTFPRGTYHPTPSARRHLAIRAPEP